MGGQQWVTRINFCLELVKENDAIATYIELVHGKDGMAIEAS